MIERFGKGQHKQFVKWFEKNPSGYIWNEQKSTLHRAACRHLQKFAQGVPPEEKVPKKRSTPKFCAPTKKELYNSIPGVRLVRAHCSVCNP